MRSTLAHLTSAMRLSIVCLGALHAAPCIAQTAVSSMDELRRELAPGDVITVVGTDATPITGRLMRVGDDELQVRAATRRGAPRRGSPDLTIPFTAIESIERRRDSARNGAGVGAAIGAGVGGAMFVHAMVVDRNEMDEWAALYVGTAAVCTGLGALVGWAVDAAHSKPHIRFESPSARRTTVSVQPRYSRRGGIALAVSFSR